MWRTGPYAIYPFDDYNIDDSLPFSLQRVL
jgi:hypothetical protein